MRKLIALALFVCAAVLAAPQPTKAIICQLGLCPTTPPALPTSSVGPGPWIVGRVMVSAPRSPMGRAVQLGLDKSAVERLLRVTIEGLDRAEQLGSYSAATAVIAACLRLVNAAAMAGSALSNGISAKQRSWKRTSC